MYMNLFIRHKRTHAHTYTRECDECFYTCDTVMHVTCTLSRMYARTTDDVYNALDEFLFFHSGTIGRTFSTWRLFAHLSRAIIKSLAHIYGDHNWRIPLYFGNFCLTTNWLMCVCCHCHWMNDHHFSFFSVCVCVYVHCMCMCMRERIDNSAICMHVYVACVCMSFLIFWCEVNFALCIRAVWCGHWCL